MPCKKYRLATFPSTGLRFLRLLVSLLGICIMPSLGIVIDFFLFTIALTRLGFIQLQNLLILAQHSLYLFSVLYRPSSVCDANLDTSMSFPRPPSYAYSPLHLMRNSHQLFVLYPALHSSNPGPTLSFSLSFSLSWKPCYVSSTPLLTRPCSSLSRHQAPCLCFTRPLYTLFSARAGVVGLVRGFVPCLI